jgi:D-alanyl-lipoteichoic acid acyltransferase DltB (MBOAT superfamily)
MVFDTTGASALTSTIDPNVLLGLAIALVVTLLASLVPPSQGNFVLTLLSLVSAVVYHWRSFPGFVAVTGIAYLAVLCLNTRTNRSRRWHWACALLFLLLAVFAAGRLRHWESVAVSVHSVPILIYSLDMWLLLRLVTLFWEVGSGAVAAPSPARFILWVCLPFTLGGPLLRYSEMPSVVHPDRQLWKSGGWWRAAAAASATLLAGIAMGFAPATLSAHWPNTHHLLKNAVGTFVTGPFGFYLETAGYFGLMEVLARPSGFKLPPSFNHPLGRENISSFWMNWNMTATFVFRDYLFFNRWGRRTYNVYFNTLLLFTLVGFWHAANSYWILWGFLHGLLFCTFMLWRKYRPRMGNLPLQGTPTARIAAAALTYFVVCMCWYLPSKIIQKLPAIAF